MKIMREPAYPDSARLSSGVAGWRTNRRRASGFFQSFHEGLSQQVLVDGQSSPSAPVTSGVPQGTVLGPLLILIYINDFPSCVSSTCRLFADDSLLYRLIRSPEGQDKLLEDLDKLQEWERDWLMAFNPTKCKVIRFTKKRRPTHGNYTIHGYTLKIAKSGKYLGVTLSEKLSWNEHVHAATKKANNSLAFLRRNLSNCPRNIKAKCYDTMVRLTLEYASTVWDPFTQRNIKKVEAVQKEVPALSSVNIAIQASPVR